MPVLLRCAAAPDAIVEGMDDLLNDRGEIELEEEDEGSPTRPTEEEVEAERQAQPTMVRF